MIVVIKRSMNSCFKKKEHEPKISILRANLIWQIISRILIVQKCSADFLKALLLYDTLKDFIEFLTQELRPCSNFDEESLAQPQ
jgi:hypothetical protein